MGLEEERFALDKQQFEIDSAFREREVTAEENDLLLKQQEAAKPAWKNPIFVAVLAAAIGFVGNVVVAALQGYYAHKQVQEKAFADEHLAREKADSDLILEASKGNYETRANNLRSLLDLGLISNPETSKRLAAVLVSGILPNTSQNSRTTDNTQTSSISTLANITESHPDGLQSPSNPPHPSLKLLVEKTVSVPPGDYAQSSNPSCSNPALENVGVVANAIATNTLSSAFPQLDSLFHANDQVAVFPPDATALSSSGGDIAKLLTPNRSAACAVIALNLKGHHVARVEIAAADQANPFAPCIEQSGPWSICQIGWSAWTYRIVDGELVATFKNWSSNRTRVARIQVFE